MVADRCARVDRAGGARAACRTTSTGIRRFCGPSLASKNGDVAVQPVNVDEVLAVLRFAGRHEIPVTVRGAGTGNYGQCVPLEGGIVLDLSLMDKLEEITPGRRRRLPARTAPGRAWKPKRASRAGNCACIHPRW